MAERPRARRGTHPVGAKERVLAASAAAAPCGEEGEGEVRGRPRRRVRAPVVFVPAESPRERPARLDSHFKVGSCHRCVGPKSNTIHPARAQLHSCAPFSPRTRTHTRAHTNPAPCIHPGTPCCSSVPVPPAAAVPTAKRATGGAELMLRFLGKEPPAASMATPRQGGVAASAPGTEAGRPRVSKLEEAGTRIRDLLKEAARLRADGKTAEAERKAREAFAVQPKGQHSLTPCSCTPHVCQPWVQHLCTTCFSEGGRVGIFTHTACLHRCGCATGVLGDAQAECKGQ